jgi:hypothetical protein
MLKMWMSSVMALNSRVDCLCMGSALQHVGEEGGPPPGGRGSAAAIPTCGSLQDCTILMRGPRAAQRVPLYCSPGRHRLGRMPRSCGCSKPTPVRSKGSYQLAKFGRSSPQSPHSRPPARPQTPAFCTDGLTPVYLIIPILIDATSRSSFYYNQFVL